MKPFKHNLFLLVILTFCITFFSCKKTDNNGFNPNNDDPDIDVINLNKTIDFSSVTDYGNDSIKFFGVKIDASLYNYGNYISFYLDSYDYTTNQHLFFQNNIQYTAEIDNFLQTLEILPSYDEGVKIPTNNAAWQDRYEYLNSSTNIYDQYNGLIKGLHGKGDRYIAFRLGNDFYNNTSYKYGWMKINLSNNHKILIIKEVALCKVPNKQIYTGAK